MYLITYIGTFLPIIFQNSVWVRNVKTIYSKNEENIIAAVIQSHEYYPPIFDYISVHK